MPCRPALPQPAATSHLRRRVESRWFIAEMSPPEQNDLPAGQHERPNVRIAGDSVQDLAKLAPRALVDSISDLGTVEGGHRHALVNREFDSTLSHFGQEVTATRANRGPAGLMDGPNAAESRSTGNWRHVA